MGLSHRSIHRFRRDIAVACRDLFITYRPQIEDAVEKIERQKHPELFCSLEFAPNAGCQPLPEAAATEERRLLAVGCTPLFGDATGSSGTTALW